MKEGEPDHLCGPSVLIQTLCSWTAHQDRMRWEAGPPPSSPGTNHQLCSGTLSNWSQTGWTKTKGTTHGTIFNETFQIFLSMITLRHN